MIKAIIFDLDGTLLDTSIGIIEAIKYTQLNLNLSYISSNEYRRFIGPPLKESFINIFNLTNDEAENAVNIFRKWYQINGSKCTKAYIGIKELLIKLKSKGLLLGVATNKREDLAVSLLHDFELIDFFDSVCGSNINNTFSKSDIIKNVANELSINLDRCLLIGDSASDAIGAQICNVPFLGVLYGFGFKTNDEVLKYSPVAVAEDINQLNDILLTIISNGCLK